MKPRVQPEPAVPAGMPLRLQRFEPDEWEAPPEPEWWTDSYGGGGMSWREFKARVLHMRARAAWLRDHGDPGPAA